MCYLGEQAPPALPEGPPPLPPDHLDVSSTAEDNTEGASSDESKIGLRVSPPKPYDTGMLCSVQLKSMEGGHHLFFCVFVEFGAVEELG